MRFVRALVAMSAVPLIPVVASSQTNNCPAYNAGAPASVESVTRDACIKGADILTYMTPQLGNGLAGGNTTPGQGGTLGGFPHFVIAVRATGAPDAALPAFASINLRATGSTPAENIPIEKKAFGLAAVDAAVGIFGGINLGIGSIGGVDALVSATYVPNFDGGSFKVKTDSPISIGYGVRVGLFNGAGLLPSVGASYVMRSLPKTTMTASAGASSVVTLQDLDLKTTSWRITASQSLIFLGLNAGFGNDTYDASTGFSAVVNPGAVSMPLRTASAKVDRSNWFVGATMNFIILKLFAEYGSVSGGNLSTFNMFNGSTTSVNDSKNYFSAGVRLGF
ncbi:MAG: hypothetical protein HYX65_03090 [Gemmatimonadetes bacterium]|nr:hypothetical protein [Gemmatimonadota bacterium]